MPHPSSPSQGTIPQEATSHLVLVGEAPTLPTNGNRSTKTSPETRHYSEDPQKWK